MNYEGILEFKGTWRKYQARVLEHADRYMSDGKIHIVAAPGSGKTTLGIELIRRMNGKALILDINYFLKEFVPGLTEEIASHSIYYFIENVLGMQIITSKRRITVEHATARDEKLLDMDGYDCVAVVVNQTFNSDGMLFEYTQSRHHPDYFCFQDIATRKKS